MMKSIGRAFWAIFTDTWCNHEWETMAAFVIWQDTFWKTEHLKPVGMDDTQPATNFARVGIVYHQKCLQCGELRTERLTS